MKLVNFFQKIFNKFFGKGKKVEEKQTCKCCISDIEERFVEVAEEKKVVEKKVVKPKQTPKKPTVKKSTIKKEKPLD